MGEPEPHARHGPTPAMVGRVLEPLYRAAIGRRNRQFDRGVGVTRLSVPVISVGNLSVGGTGKTPLVGHIVSTLLRAGAEPCIAMRGYRRRGEVVSDEAESYRRVFPGVKIVAQPDRIAGVRRWLAEPSSSSEGGAATARSLRCVVLDDGFQHRRLARDLDIVLIDASRPPMRDRLLPAGWLREPMASLARADLVVVTHAELVDDARIADIAAAVATARGPDGRARERGVDAVTRHEWTGLVMDRAGSGSRAPGGEQLLPLDWLLGKRIVGSCAIGNPTGFLHSLRATVGEGGGGGVVGTLVLPDHDPYDDAVVRALANMAEENRADAIVVTDKDWSKLRRFPDERWGGRPVVRPLLAMVFERGQSELDQRVRRAVGVDLPSP